MSTRFIHTADWQLGKPFAGITDASNRHRLQQARLDVIDRIGKAAREHQAAFIVVAGDVFDSPTPTKALVSAACSAIGRLGLPVLLIPGNHDHGGPGGVWAQSFFQAEAASLAPNLQVLLQPAPVVMAQAVVFPCPLLRRHENTDLTAWLRGDAPVAAENAGLPRIVLAHGTMQGFGSAGDDEDGGGEVINYLDLSRLASDHYDYIALGDWHGMKQVGERAWYAGTPEPDRFPKGENNDPGHILVVEVARGGAPIVTPLRTARIGWHDLDYSLADDDALPHLQLRLDELLARRTHEDLLRLRLSGALGLAAMAQLENLRVTLEARLLRLKFESTLVIAPTEAEIHALTQRSTDPLITRVAQQLMEKTRSPDAGESAVARTALRSLHLGLHVSA